MGKKRRKFHRERLASKKEQSINPSLAGENSVVQEKIKQEQIEKTTAVETKKVKKITKVVEKQTRKKTPVAKKTKAKPRSTRKKSTSSK